MRGRSYSPSPPRGYSRRGRSPSPRGRYGGRSRDEPTSLLVRNLRLDCRPEDLKKPFGRFGPVKDIYLPRDYYTGEPRGFGFVQYVEPADASDAKYEMDGSVFQGRQLTVVFAEENRKKPQQMRARERSGSYRGRDYDRRSSRYSRSPPRRKRSLSPTKDYYASPPKRGYSRSESPQERRERSYTHSPPKRGRSPSRSPVKDRSPSGSRSRSPFVRSPSPSGRGRSRGRSPIVERDYTPSPRRDRSR